MKALEKRGPSFFEEVRENKTFYLLLCGVMVTSLAILFILGGIINFGDELQAILDDTPLLMFINNGFSLSNIINFVFFSIFCDYAVDRLFELFAFLNGKKLDDFKYQRPIAVLQVPLKCLLFTFVIACIPQPDIAGFLSKFIEQIKSGSTQFVPIAFNVLVVVWALRVGALAVVYFAEYFITSMISSVISIAAFLGLGLAVTNLKILENISEGLGKLIVFLIVIISYYLIDALININFFEKSQEKIRTYAKTSFLAVAKDFLLFTVIGWILLCGCIDMALHTRNPIKKVIGKFYGISLSADKKVHFDSKVFINHIAVSVVYNLINLIMPILFLGSLVLLGIEELPKVIAVVLMVLFYFGGMYIRSAMQAVYIEMFKFPEESFKSVFKNSRMRFLETERQPEENGALYFLRCFGRVVRVMAKTWLDDIKLMFSTVIIYPKTYENYRRERIKAVLNYYDDIKHENIEEDIEEAPTEADAIEVTEAFDTV